MPGHKHKRLRLAPMPPRRRGSTVWVAFSGGVDSSVLLHVLASRKIARLKAVHVHHGLQAWADDWVDHCRAVCKILDVELEVIRVECESAGKGPEAAARQARYQAIRERLNTGDILTTAHHVGDQAETVLMRLLRGTGPTGLAAIRPTAPFKPGFLWRPMLAITREQIEAYANSRGLAWIDDPSNRNVRFARNFLRHEILPALESEWPKAQQNLARAADLAAENVELLRDLAMMDLSEWAEPQGPLPVECLLSLSLARRNNLVRHWVAGLGLPVPFHDTLRRLDTEVLYAGPEASPVLAWPGGEFRRYRNRLFAMQPLPAVPDELAMAWNCTSDLELPEGCGRLRAVAEQAEPVHTQVRLARPGERFKPFGSPISRTLKNLFQERGVPGWVRQRTPVVVRDGQAVWVGGIGWCAGRDWSGMRIEIEWLERPPAALPDL